MENKFDLLIFKGQITIFMVILIVVGYHLILQYAVYNISRTLNVLEMGLNILFILLVFAIILISKRVIRSTKKLKEFNEYIPFDSSSGIAPYIQNNDRLLTYLVWCFLPTSLIVQFIRLFGHIIPKHGVTNTLFIIESFGIVLVIVFAIFNLKLGIDYQKFEEKDVIQKAVSRRKKIEVLLRKESVTLLFAYILGVYFLILEHNIYNLYRPYNFSINTVIGISFLLCLLIVILLSTRLTYLVEDLREYNELNPYGNIFSISQSISNLDKILTRVFWISIPLFFLLKFFVFIAVCSQIIQ